MKSNDKFITIMICIVLIMGIFVSSSSSVFAKSDKNRKIAKQYCKEHYPKLKVVFLKKYDEKKLLHRKNCGKIYVERVISWSEGHYGYDKDGYYIWYNKKVKKGKKVISYLVYNPTNNYCDDVIAVIDNEKIRWVGFFS